MAMCLAAGVILPAIPAGASSLSVTGFSPTSGPVGTKATITGTGFASGDIVQFNGTAATKSTAGAGGTTLTTHVPAFATSGPIVVTDPTTGQTASLPGTVFQVTTGLSVSPRHAWPGKKVTVAGSGLSPDQTEELMLRDETIGTIRTDENGDFQTKEPLPWGLDGGHAPIWVLDPSLGRILITILLLSAWPQIHHDPALLGVNPHETTLSPSTVQAGLTAGPTVSFGSSSLLDVSPTVAVGEVFMSATGTSGTGYVYAVNPAKSTVIWQSQPIAGTVGTTAIDAGMVFAGAADDHMYAFPINCTSPCKPKWVSSTAGGFLDRPPTIYNGDVYVGATDDKVYVYPESCTNPCGPLWVSKATGGLIDGAPAVDNGEVYVASADDKLYAFPTTCSNPCSPDWVSDPTQGPIFGSPSVSGKQIFVASGTGSQGYVYDFSTSCKNGCAPTWTSSVQSGDVQGTPVVASGDVYAIIGDTIYGFPAAASCSNPCSSVWQSTSGSGPTGGDALAAADGVLYAVLGSGSTGASLSAFSLSCGGVCSPIWSSSEQDFAYSSPAISDGEIYVSSPSQHSLFVYGP
jgi:hypothetical protein